MGSDQRSKVLRRVSLFVLAALVGAISVVVAPAAPGGADGNEAPGAPYAFRSITAGGNHTCALLDNGTVKCWGSNTSGQLGQGHTAARGDGPNEMGDNLPAVDLGAGRTATALTAGGAHTCALLDNGSVKCWGNNGLGRLGLGDTANRGDAANEMGDNLPAVDLGAGRTATAVTAGPVDTCALLDNGTVKCWGDNFYGQLGLGDTAPRGTGPNQMGDNLPAVDLGAGRTATAVTAGTYDTCALLDDGTVKCWGFNQYGQLGLGDAAARGDGPNEMGDNLPAVDLGAGLTATAVSAGALHTCARLDNATVKCWGDNDFGRLGLGDSAHRGDGPGEMGDNLPAVDLGAGRTATGVSAGGEHTCARLDNATVKCWGYNGSGRLGLGDTLPRGDQVNEMGDNLPAVDLGAGRTANAVTTGSEHECARLDDGTVKCWGNNGLGRLGLGDTANRGDAANEMGDNLPIVVLRPPAFTVAKSADETAVVPGEAIHYHVTVTNAGDVALTGITVADEEAPTCAGPIADLAVGAHHTIDCTYTTGLGDGGSTITNVATVDTTQTAPIDSNGVDVEVGPAMTVVKTAPATVIAGDPVPYQVDVTNTSAITLRRVRVNDPFAAACTQALPNISAGQTRTVACNRATTNANTGATLVNLAIVTTRDGGFAVSDAVETRVRGRVTGTITGPGGPIAGAYVLALHRNFTPLQGDAVTNASGTYSIGLDPGGYYLAFLDPTGAHLAEYYNNKTSVTQLGASDLVTVAHGSGPVTANAALGASGFTPPANPATISGTVTGPVGPVAGVWVVVVSTGVVGATRTDAAGHYSVGNLPAGTIYVEFADPSGLHAFRWYHNDNGANPTPITLTAGQHLTGVDEALPSSP